MPNLYRDLGFDLDQPMRTSWLKTYKKSYDYAGEKLPGFFVTNDFGLHRAAFITAMILEVLTIGLLIRTGMPLWAVLVPILFEVVCAIAKNSSRDELIKWKQKVAVATLNLSIVKRHSKDQNDITRAANSLDVAKQSKPTKHYLIFAICFAVIIIATIAKILFIVKGIGIFVARPYIMLYVLVALFHLYGTGNWFTEWMISRTIRQKRNNGRLGTPPPTTFESFTEIPKTSTPYHKIVDIPTPANAANLVKKYHYRLESQVTMTDDDLRALVGANNNNPELLRACLEHQLNQC